MISEISYLSAISPISAPSILRLEASGFFLTGATGFVLLGLEVELRGSVLGLLGTFFFFTFTTAGFSIIITAWVFS